MPQWERYAGMLAANARHASRLLAQTTGGQKNRWLNSLAELIQARGADVLEENARDVEMAPGFGLTAAETDRLKLSTDRLNSVASAIREIAMLTDPVGEAIDGTIRPNGLSVRRVRVPLGVVFFIFESRPNVTVDAASICVKSGNAVILRGGKEALRTNMALYRLIQESLELAGLPKNAVQMVETPEREVVGELLKLEKLIDVTIPRGGRSLIQRVTSEATMPVMKHFDGVCHVYVDEAADVGMALRILINAKCQRPGVCNAAECLLVHQNIAADFLPLAGYSLQKRNVEVRGCDRIRQYLPWAKRASDDDYRTEYLDLILSARVVDDLDRAIDHIEEFGSHHTDAIITDNLSAASRFVAGVDSAAVVVNASTRFNDGGELGLGAEIGISTDRFHARGPCGLRELTTYKWIVEGNGQTRG